MIFTFGHHPSLIFCISSTVIEMASRFIFSGKLFIFSFFILYFISGVSSRHCFRCSSDNDEECYRSPKESQKCIKNLFDDQSINFGLKINNSITLSSLFNRNISYNNLLSRTDLFSDCGTFIGARNGRKYVIRDCTSRSLSCNVYKNKLAVQGYELHECIRCSYDNCNLYKPRKIGLKATTKRTPTTKSRRTTKRKRITKPFYRTTTYRSSISISSNSSNPELWLQILSGILLMTSLLYIIYMWVKYGCKAVKKIRVPVVKISGTSVTRGVTFSGSDVSEQDNDEVSVQSSENDVSEQDNDEVSVQSSGNDVSEQQNDDDSG